MPMPVRTYVYLGGDFPKRVRPVKARPLPARQAEALAFIRSELADGRGFPSTAAIAKHLGWKSASSAIDVLKRLRRAGYVRVGLRSKRRGKPDLWEMV